MVEERIEEISIDALKTIGEDLCNGLLRKHVIADGRGETVTERSNVVLELRIMIRGHTALQYSNESPFVQCVERVLPPGLRIALLSMRAEERALVWIDEILGFGSHSIMLESSGRRIRRNSDLVIEVVLKSWTKPDIDAHPLRRSNLTWNCVPLINQEMELAESMMRKGNNIRALALLRGCSHKACRLRIDAEAQPANEKLRKDLMFELAVRTAECALQLGRYPLAVSRSREALQLKPFNAYANYVSGCAYFALGLSCASRFLLAAHHLDVSNEVYRRKLTHLKSHESLLERDVTDESIDLDSCETFAQSCLSKLIASEKSMKADIQSFINLQLELGVRSMKIGGGFRKVFLEKIAEKISRRSKEVNAEIRDDTLYLYS